MTRSLFDLLRDNSEQGAPKLEELTSELLKQGYLPQASRVGERGRAGLEELKKGVERAAENVLGDDADELRLAERQLDDLARQLQNEMSDAQGRGSTNGTSGANAGERPGGQRGSAQAANTQPENGDANAQAPASQPNRSSEQARGQRGNAP